MVMTKRVKMQDQVGNVFGRLVVNSVYREGRRSYAECICACGNKLTTRIDALQTGATVSCGCYNREVVSALHKKHGMSHTRTYSSWEAMKARCDNPNNESYCDYGGSGIQYDKSWKEFVNFLEDMGVCPDKHSIDRIDGSKGYSKENCRWATLTTQARNQKKRSGSISQYKGVSFDKRALTGGWFFKTYRDYKHVSKYCESEIQAAAFYDYCSNLLYTEEVSLNNVSYKLSQEEKTMLAEMVNKKFPEILNKENNNAPQE